MSSSVSLVVVRKDDFLVVKKRPIGSLSMLSAVREMLGEPSISAYGYNSWLVSPQHVDRLADPRNVSMIARADVQKLAKEFPEDEYAWSIVHDY